MNDTFYMSEDHLKLLRAAYVDSYSVPPKIGAKRPYGNGDVLDDVARIVDAKPVLVKHGEKVYSEEQEAFFQKLHEGTATALQIVLCTGEFKAGTYEKQEKYNSRSWKYVGPLPEPQKASL